MRCMERVSVVRMRGEGCPMRRDVSLLKTGMLIMSMEERRYPVEE